MRVRLSYNKRVVSPCGGLSAVAPLLHNIRERRSTHASRGEDNELPFKPQNDQGFAGFGAYTHTHAHMHARKYIYIYIYSTQAINSRIEIKTQFTRPGFPRVFKNVRSVYNMLTARAATVARGRGGDDDDEMRPHSYFVEVYYVQYACIV